MREYTTPRTARAAEVGNLTDPLVQRARDEPDTVALSIHADGTWTDVSVAAFLREVKSMAKGLVAAGVEPGDRVALMSSTRYEWTLTDYAIWYAGAVSVPVYGSTPLEQLSWILADSGATAAVVETFEHRARLLEASRDDPAGGAARQVWTIDEGGLKELAARGASVGDAELEERRLSARFESLATIVYTSGTTGRPKGCMLTHGNLLSEVESALDDLSDVFGGDDPATLLFLPLAHVFARVIQVGSIQAGVRLGHLRDVTSLLDSVREFRPTFLLAVPRAFEIVFNTASQRAVADGRGRTFDKAASTAIAFSEALDAGRPGRVLRGRHAMYDRLVYDRIRRGLGGRCAFAVSGGAPLGERLGHFYRGVGIPVLEGYGLTETTAAVTVNRPAAQRVGTVGQPLSGASVRIADDGEILLRGPQIMAGYWQDPDATAGVLDDSGWLRTGDLGEIDDEGFLRVTGRKKELLVTAGGKNVAPAPLEEQIRAHPLVSQALVVGDGRPFIAAVVTLDTDAATLWARRNGKSSDPADLVDDPDLLAEIQSAVNSANALVSQAESVRKVTVLTDDWTEEAGHLTPSLKLRRGHVEKLVADEIDRLYRT